MDGAQEKEGRQRRNQTGGRGERKGGHLDVLCTGVGWTYGEEVTPWEAG
jgi:hypothetical protein